MLLLRAVEAGRNGFGDKRHFTLDESYPIPVLDGGGTTNHGSGIQRRRPGEGRAEGHDNGRRSSTHGQHISERTNREQEPGWVLRCPFERLYPGTGNGQRYGSGGVGATARGRSLSVGRSS